LKENKKRKIVGFSFAFKGLLQMVLHERNFQIHIVIMFLVVFAGFYFSISKLEWISLILTIIVVLGFEMINGAIERAMDYVAPEWHEQVGRVKDISAGAVLVSAIGSVVIGILIFGSYIW